MPRREFFRAAAGTAAALLLCGCDKDAINAYLQKRFQELSPDEVKAVLARLERKYKAKFGKDVTVSAKPARGGVLFGYGLDLSRCIGCRRCVYACVKENNLSRQPQTHWIRVLEQEKAKGVDLEDANPYYDPETVPRDGYFYIPVACQQCRRPPCTKACPVKATWTEPDGIVVIDYDWCIGCRCCMAACPYGARHFNWGEPTLPPEDVNPSMHYLGNRPRPRGVVEKCTFCIQRTRDGRYPACVEICPVGARKFGNLLDPQSEIRLIMEQKRVFVLKSELKTEPKFYYFYSL
ncbi:MAG: 4Fe-4S ferredoxin [Lentisphaerae bacterium RIFOXYB12_FULL_65_16]|nr:MAG: 4Fe-4S ferredoxin [Lentisphaerae bacterium RIFOXYA12_64_32]OGV93132.1 MAG: 4Fe-4S ferredoxin [Lentisphaerae bacterium RIFOXYB12_FULL_65_16]